jgi:hypothetical protein
VQIVQQYLSIQADAQALTRRPRWLIEINSVLGVLGLLLFLCFLLLNPTWFHDNRSAPRLRAACARADKRAGCAQGQTE